MAIGLPATSMAQDKVEATVGADLVSGYIWRGQDFGGSLKEFGLIGIADLQVFKNTLGITSHNGNLLSNAEAEEPLLDQLYGNILPGNLQDCNRNPALTMFFC